MSWKVTCSILYEVVGFFSWPIPSNHTEFFSWPIPSNHTDLGANSASNRNEYQESSWG
jgi:hypothetical protein